MSGSEKGKLPQSDLTGVETKHNRRTSAHVALPNVDRSPCFVPLTLVASHNRIRTAKAYYKQEEN
jgi:hypothetical protein